MGAHIGSCVLCLLETVSRELLSLIGPALYPGAVAGGWLGSVPQLWLRMQIRHAAVTSAALPLCQAFQTDPGGTGAGEQDDPHELECQRKTEAGQEQTETNRRHVEKQIIVQRHEEGNQEWKEGRSLLQLVQDLAVSWRPVSLR